MAACRENHRAQRARAAAAAGRGLPAVEAGMPAPAGTGLSRRAFVLQAAGLALSVYGAGRLPLFEPGVAQAAAAAGGTDRVIVQVYLEGGIDAVQVLAPTTDALYRRLRPTLALPAGGGTAFREDDRLRWHPSAAPLARLHQEGKVCVMPAVGYTHPDQSHFVSRHFYEVGALDPAGRSGWMGRYLDRAGSADNPLQGLSLDGSLAPALATTSKPVAAIDSPGAFDFWARDVWGEVGDLMLDSFGRIGAAHAGSRDAALRQAGAGAVQAASVRTQLAPFAPPKDDHSGAPSFVSPVTYPKDEDGFPTRMAGLAAMLAAGLPLKCVAVTAPGSYDTHSGEREVMDKDLALTCQTLEAFQRDLEARALADRVIVHVWSEFGRRAQENDGGTDHGAAGLGLVIGTRATGRMVGEFPGLAKLDRDGNLIATSDFRGVYAALLEQWLGADAAAILPDARGLARPALIR
jgi:uncharacterized protein (DUF1501 family)